jgi:hypothetical protein
MMTTTTIEDFIKEVFELAKRMFNCEITELPVNISITDSKLFEASMFNDIPHFTSCKTTEEKESRLLLLLENVRIAAKKLDDEIKIKNISLKLRPDELQNR